MEWTQLLIDNNIPGAISRMNFSVRRRSRHHSGKLSFQVLGIWIGVLIIGVVLFFHVWWPIQAEMASSELKRLQGELSVKKSELERLKTQYEQMVSLASLEHVAKSRGQWTSPSIEHVITISQ